jgi:hypothetical protein
MTAETKDVFLCFNKADKEWTEQLGQRIEAETIDGLASSRKLTVFFSEWDIDYGENAINRMNVGLSSARYFVPIMTPEFFKSGWTNFEWTDVVSDDPWGAHKKIIPLRLRDSSLDGAERIALPAPFKALKYFDFRDKTRFESEFVKLLRRIRGLPPERGAALPSRYSAATLPAISNDDEESWLPDQLREVLLGNLLEVKSFPPSIWSAPTEKETPAQVRAEVPDAEGHIIRAKRLFTFADLSSETCFVRQVVDVSEITEESTREWLLDPTKINWWIALINQALTRHLSKLAIKREEKGRYFFRPNKDGTTRQWRNGRDKPREVAAKKNNPTDGSIFWVHHAARIKFNRFGQEFFLMIEPTYLFTTDGEHPFGGQQMGRMVMMWGGKQKNADILRNFVFWAKAIAKNGRQMRIETSGAPIILSAIPAMAVANVGVESDHIRVGALMNAVEDELDDVAQDIEVVPEEEIDEEEEPGETEAE